MPSPSPVCSPRAVRPKSKAQQAKAAANVVKAARRFALLQQEQQEMNELRASGVVGGDATLRAIIQKRREEATKARWRAERAEEEQKSRQFVSMILSGPHGPALTHFIGRGLNGNPCKVALVVRNWIRVQGR